jgi:hypothetical protein
MTMSTYTSDQAGDADRSASEVSRFFIGPLDNPFSWTFVGSEDMNLDLRTAESVVTDFMDKGEQMPNRRVVQVYVVDPDERVPIEGALLYEGEAKFTDATDQELFFELPIKELLDEHNTVRQKLTDEKASMASGRDVTLKPIRIRDLKMTVVTLAAF